MDENGHLPCPNLVMGMAPTDAAGPTPRGTPNMEPPLTLVVIGTVPGGGTGPNDP